MFVRSLPIQLSVSPASCSPMAVTLAFNLKRHGVRVRFLQVFLSTITGQLALCR